MCKISEQQKTEFITNPYFIGFVLSVISSIALYVIFYLTNGRRNRRLILLVGIQGAGKTSIFTQLANSGYRQAGTSPSETIDKYFSFGSRWRIVDTPGKMRLKYIYFNYCKEWAKGIVFIINMITINEEKYTIAEYIDMIINDPVIRENKVPILIYCNRYDSVSMIDMKSIEKFLERHISIYRMYFTNPIDEINPPENEPTDVELSSEDTFLFESCPCKVQFGSCSNFTEETDASELEDLMEWIFKI